MQNRILRQPSDVTTSPELNQIGYVLGILILEPFNWALTRFIPKLSAKLFPAFDKIKIIIICSLILASGVLLKAYK